MDPNALELGKHAGTLRLQGVAALRAHGCRMAGQGRRLLQIYSHRLHPELYDRPCFVEAARRLALRHPRTRVQILVADTAELAKGGHRLLRLAQELPSSIEIRRRSDEHEGDLRSFLLVDDQGYLLRNPWHDLDTARGDYSARPVVRRLAEAFQRVWDCSESDPGLRRLHL